MKTKKTLLLWILFFGLFLQGIAQESKIDKKVISELGNSTFINFNEANSYKVSQVQSFFKEELNIKSNDELKEINVKTDRLSFTHYTYQHYYNNIKVEHGIYKVHIKDGLLKRANGEFYDVKLASTTATISAKRAFETLLTKINAKTYAWENEDNPLRGDYQKPEGELVILPVKNSRKTGFEYKLVYKYDIYTFVPFDRAIYFVDANSGNIVAKEQIMCSSDAETMYSGQRTIETQGAANGFPNGFRLFDETRGNGIHTRNNQGALNTNLGGAIDFIDADDNWTAAEWNNADQDQAALDAHWGLEMTYDYFSNVHERDSYDGSGARINAFVHVIFPVDNNGNTSPNNAQWTGDNIVFGDGDGTAVNPLTSIDICAHEFGHAINQALAPSSLVYLNESGALDEGLADIWGACVVSMAAPEKNRWFAGEDIMITAYAARDMSDPKNLNLPDTYEGDFWATGPADFGGVHTNSSVLNHWFFLLVEGSASTDGENDNGDTFTVNGIGIFDAERIAYRMQTEYLTPGSTFALAREGAINAATDLFGACSPQTVATQNAFYAVGVGDESEIEELVAFHFQDAQGNIKNEFCDGEIIFLNGNATIQGSQNKYYMDVWRVNNDGTTTWLASQGSSNTSSPGWFNGSPGLIDITDLYASDPDGSVIFQNGVTYRVKLAINANECGWFPLEHDFTMHGSDIEFHYEDAQKDKDIEFCLGEDVFLNGSDNFEVDEYFLTLYKLNSSGTYTWIVGTGWIQGNLENPVNVTEIFENLPGTDAVTFHPRTYAVKLSLKSPGCGQISVQKDFTYVDGNLSIAYHYEDKDGNKDDTFCLGESVYLNGSDSIEVDEIFMSLWILNGSGNYEWIVGTDWIPSSLDNPIDITGIFENLPGNNAVTFQANRTYAVKLSIMDPVCGQQWLQQSFTLEECCLLDPPTTIQTLGNTVVWNAVPGAVGYIVESTNVWAQNCSCNWPISMVPIQTSNTSVTLPLGFNNCTSIQIRTICSNGSTSLPSDLICVQYGHSLASRVAITSISPNPNKGMMNVKIVADTNIKDVSLKIHNFNGHQIQKFEQLKLDKGVLELNLDLRSKLKQGLYIFIFTVGNETITKRVVIE
jgi:Zn-dependent metalloprotease